MEGVTMLTYVDSAFEEQSPIDVEELED